MRQQSLFADTCRLRTLGPIFGVLDTDAAKLHGKELALIGMSLHLFACSMQHGTREADTTMTSFT